MDKKCFGSVVHSRLSSTWPPRLSRPTLLPETFLSPDQDAFSYSRRRRHTRENSPSIRRAAMFRSINLRGSLLGAKNRIYIHERTFFYVTHFLKTLLPIIINYIVCIHLFANLNWMTAETIIYNPVEHVGVMEKLTSNRYKSFIIL